MSVHTELLTEVPCLPEAARNGVCCEGVRNTLHHGMSLPSLVHRFYLHGLLVLGPEKSR